MTSTTFQKGQTVKPIKLPVYSFPHGDQRKRIMITRNRLLEISSINDASDITFFAEHGLYASRDFVLAE